MRIISKQRDFYDFVAGYGVDKNVVYVRDVREHTIDRDDPLICLYTDFETEKGKVDVNQVKVAICGETFTFWYRADHKNEPFDDFDDMLDAEPKIKRRMWFYVLERYTKDFSHANEQYGSPIVISGVGYNSPYRGDYTEKVDGVISDVYFDGDNVLTDAPILGMLGLADKIDPTQIWMLLDNWVSTRQSKETVEIANQDRIVKAGFDTKVSFRNQKGRKHGA